MENDFLDGIDEQFQRLMKLNGNGKRNGRSKGHTKDDRLINEIVDQLHSLTHPQREEVLAFIQSKKQKG